MLCYVIFETCWGWAGVAGSEKGLRKVVLPQHTPEMVLRELADLLPWAHQSEKPFDDLPHRLRCYFEGLRVNFPDKLDLSQSTPFRKLVWEKVRFIPYGETRSYAWVAGEIGKPRALRAVGQALKYNPLPILIPCHRVIGSEGRLVGFGGKANLELKRRLLQLEASRSC